MNATNATASVASSTSTPLPGDFHSLVSTLFSISALADWFNSSLSRLTQALWITATFDANDESYRWMLYWLSRNPIWNEARTIAVSTRSFGLDADEDEDSSSSLGQVSYLPSLESTYNIWYRGHYVTVSREERSENQWSSKETLRIQILSRNRAILQSILDEAREAFKAAQTKLISIHAADIHGDWNFMASRPKRPLSSIILDPGIKELLLNDARDFLGSRRWYSDRGIPFRRGYLLYGAPGSGKTSMIQSIAGELGLNVYIVTLSRIGLDDSALNELISNMPRRCIALMEDIDAAFTAGIKRDLPLDIKRPGEDGDAEDAPKSPREQAQAQGMDTGSRITLSGLLNALDGIGAQEGRILFATTNNYKALDPALCRPGRMDLHIEFRLASRYQAENLYKCFYMPSGADEPEVVKVDEGYDSRRSSVGSDEADDEKTSELEPLLSSPPTPSPPYSPSLSKPINSLIPSHLLPRREVLALAARFADAIPERELSMASLQGYLMTYKSRPREAVDEVSQWIENERRARRERS
ncbi:P-loop containing nucleoside triphosphate hydrolase protein [Fomitopsis serialis]|uniref:P-loop containing nucleoside triphosphate hydrolase protein n=1 Tax=Fomitopsis serialis TaxID=139415 RepID=UPI0020088FA2|nr:P-loop containing nucleoside triphosphate hydrolase protein [Neoantrodia serialis]KAH9918672.1 P-loop containing nucleoside triphosphate hydrolase protein [Neoantrodia serialis]